MICPRLNTAVIAKRKMNYRELYEFGCLQLKTAVISDYKTDARLLLEYVCKTSYNDLYVNGEKEIPFEKEEEYRSMLEKRASHIPLQHLTGIQTFMGLDFKVNSNVLVPRPDTEILVEEVLKDTHDGMRILDMCTGSGCILLSLINYSNDTQGVGADISPAALEVAKENAEKLGLFERVSFVESNLFEGIEGKFDIVVSNPPYIKTKEIETLMPEVKEYDPFIALDGHEDGLFFYRKIVKECKPFLFRGSLLAFEIGNDQASEVSKLLEEEGFADISVYKDYGNNDRVVKGFYRG